MSNREDIHILVVGTGAVGAFYGSRLHQPDQGVIVSFTCRSNYEEVKQDGIELNTRSFGNYRMKPHRVFKSIDEAARHQVVGSTEGSRSWDFVILCTKVLPDLVDDPELVSPFFLDPQNPPTLVLIQNGIGFEDLHRKRHPNVPLLSAVTIVNAQQIKPGVIRQNNWTRISLGPYVNFTYAPQPSTDRSVDGKLAKTCQAQLELLVQLFQRGGIKDAEVYGETELQVLRWHKLAINATMNPSSVLSGGLTSSEMVSNPELRVHLEACMQEVFTAAHRIFKIPSFPPHFATIDQLLDSTRKAGTHSIIKPSMLVDWENNRPLEIEAILGIPIRIAARAGVKLERIQSMYAFLSLWQRSRSAKDNSNRARM